MAQDSNESISPPLQPIKQVELWKKRGPLLPKYGRENTCPRSADKVIDMIRVTKREKSCKKTEEKQNSKAKK
eukprot:538029-Ditylum_brightwellii.AAC.1